MQRCDRPRRLLDGKNRQHRPISGPDRASPRTLGAGEVVEGGDGLVDRAPRADQRALGGVQV